MRPDYARERDDLVLVVANQGSQDREIGSALGQRRCQGRYGS